MTIADGDAETVDFIDETFGSVRGTVLEDTNDDSEDNVPIGLTIITLFDSNS